MVGIDTPIPLKEILKALGWSRRKFFYRLDELIRDEVIFYRYEGRPPVRRIYAYPSTLKTWAGGLAKKGRMV